VHVPIIVSPGAIPMTELMTQVFDVSCWLSACKCSTGTVPRAVRRCFSVTRARTFPSRIHLRSRAYPVLRILCGWGNWHRRCLQHQFIILMLTSSTSTTPIQQMHLSHHVPGYKEVYVDPKSILMVLLDMAFLLLLVSHAI
jgi:hypothetical protein